MTSFQTSVIGSFPRPRWLITAYEQHETGAISTSEYESFVDDATKLTIKEQELAGIDLITDGEQQRTSFVGFVGQKIPGMSAIPIELLNPDAKEILREKKTLLTHIRAVCVDKLSEADLVVEDYLRARSLTSKRLKVSLPAPYLMMWEAWHAEKSRKFYPHPEDMAHDFAEILKKNIHDLYQKGVRLISLDEPMLGDLTEAGDKPDRYHEVLSKVYGQKYRGFHEEVKLAVDMLNEVTVGLPDDLRVLVHMDRWPNADSPHFGEGYERFLPTLLEAKVDEFDLEYASPGCGDPTILAKSLAENGIDLGIGCVSVTDHRVETPEEITARVEPVVPILGGEHLTLVPNCGFAPGMRKRFPRDAAFKKLTNMAAAAKMLREKHG